MMIIAQTKFDIKSEPDRPLAECQLEAYGARALRNAKLCAETF